MVRTTMRLYYSGYRLTNAEIWPRLVPRDVVGSVQMGSGQVLI